MTSSYNNLAVKDFAYFFLFSLFTQNVFSYPILNEHKHIESTFSFSNQSTLCQTKECYNYGNKIFQIRNKIIYINHYIIIILIN
jgi:hypothetical protein